MRAASQKKGRGGGKTDQTQTVSDQKSPKQRGRVKAQGPHLKPKVRRVRETEGPGGGWEAPAAVGRARGSGKTTWRRPRPVQMS